MDKKPKVSIIMSARNEAQHIEKTIVTMVKNTEYSDYEIIALNDNSTDDTEAILANIKLDNVKTFKSSGLGTAKARNLAFNYSRGELVLFCDAHITVPPGWLEKLVDISNNVSFDVLSVPMSPDPTGVLGGNMPGYGQTFDKWMRTTWYLENPGYYKEVAISPGGCALYKREVFKKIGGYDKGFNVWGFEDVEISIKAWLFGYVTKVAYDLCIEHFFRTKAPFSVDNTEYFYNYVRTAYLHFSAARIEKFKDLLFETYRYKSKDKENIIAAITKKIEDSDTLRQREIYFTKRKRTDDWYFDFFNIDF